MCRPLQKRVEGVPCLLDRIGSDEDLAEVVAADLPGSYGSLGIDLTDLSKVKGDLPEGVVVVFESGCVDEVFRPVGRRVGDGDADAALDRCSECDRL